MVNIIVSLFLSLFSCPLSLSLSQRRRRRKKLELILTTALDYYVLFMKSLRNSTRWWQIIVFQNAFEHITLCVPSQFGCSSQTRRKKRCGEKVCLSLMLVISSVEKKKLHYIWTMLVLVRAHTCSNSVSFFGKKVLIRTCVRLYFSLRGTAHNPCLKPLTCEPRISYRNLSVEYGI